MDDKTHDKPATQPGASASAESEKDSPPQTAGGDASSMEETSNKPESRKGSFDQDNYISQLEASASSTTKERDSQVKNPGLGRHSTVPLTGTTVGQDVKGGHRNTLTASEIGAVAVTGTTSRRVGQSTKRGLRNSSTCTAGNPESQIGAIPASSSDNSRGHKTKRGLRNSTNRNSLTGTPRLVGSPQTSDSGTELSTKRGLRNHQSPRESIQSSIIVNPNEEYRQEHDTYEAENTAIVGAVRSSTTPRSLGESKTKRDLRFSRKQASGLASDRAATRMNGGTLAATRMNGGTLAATRMNGGTLAMEEGRALHMLTPVVNPVEDYEDDASVHESVAVLIDDSQLVSAHAVEDPPVLQVADEWDHKQQELARQQRVHKARSKNRTYLGGGLVLVIAIAVVIGFVVNNNQGDDTIVFAKATSSPTGFPTPSPTWQGYAVLELLPESTVETIALDGTPQRKAYDWLMEDMEGKTYSDMRLVQRFALATLYYATGGETEWTTNLDYKWIIGKSLGWQHNNTVTWNADLESESFGWLDHSLHECDWPFTNQSHVLFDVADKPFYPMADNPCTTLAADGSLDEERTYEYLWLNWGGLKGSIPDEIFLLTSLKSFELGANELNGTISTLFGQLTNLETLTLSYTQMSGSVPEEIGHCSNLMSLVLTGDYGSEKNLSGTIPATIWELSSLKHLWLDVQGFSGTIPSTIGTLTNLETIVFEQTPFQGSLPTTLGNLRNLVDLNMPETALAGSLPSELGVLSNLKAIALHFNKFTGTLPTELGLLENLFELVLDYNLFSGSIPSQLGELTNLSAFMLANNQLSGTIPTQLQFPLAQTVTLGVNNLTGTVPTELGLLESSFILALQENSLFGTIPSELGQLMAMDTLIISGNDLTGSIPPEVADLPNLVYLLADKTSLTGTLPVFASVASGLAIEPPPFLADSTFNISQSLFVGEIPPEMCPLEMQGRLQFDCSDTLCGCSCDCSTSTTTIDIIPTVESRGNGNNGAK